MSNYQFPSSNQDFSAESFGQPMYQQPRGGGGGRAFLFSCGGLALIGILICCCCAGVVYYVVQQPVAVALAWGIGAQGNDWTMASNATCQGSQARQLTQRYQNAGVTFQGFTTNSGDFSSTSLTFTAQRVNSVGPNTTWTATFHMVKQDNDSGFSPYCVDRIEVTQGDLP